MSRAAGPGESLGYRPELDGLRGIAIAMVVGLHAFGVPHTGTFGVDLFFVLSGFLITTLIFEERAETGALSVRAFYARRARRLYPALIVLVLVFFVWVLLFAERTSAGADAKQSVVGLTYVTNVALAWPSLHWPVAPALTHLWSLSAEEQFYIVWPFVLICIGFRKRVALLVLAVATADLLYEQISLAHRAGIELNRIAYGPDVRSSTSILIGCLIGVLWSSRARSALAAFARVAWLPALVGCAFLAFAHLPNLYGGWVTLFAALAGVLVLEALATDRFLARALRASPLVWLGRISYSLYLWHVVVIAPLHFPRPWWIEVGCVAASLVLAMCSYRFVEQRFRRHRTASVA